jgi:hypothetical protein
VGGGGAFRFACRRVYKLIYSVGNALSYMASYIVQMTDMEVSCGEVG